MRKILLTTTLIAVTTVSTNAWAFGGIVDGITGHKSHHSGVSSIGVHYNGKDDKPNIDIRTCDSETEELVGSECLPKCPEGLERNTDNSCSVCAGENANVYLSYMDDPCGTETPMNQTPCETDADCYIYMELPSFGCCDTNTHTCKSGVAFWDDEGEEGQRKRNEEMLRLFVQLGMAEQNMIIAQMKGLLANHEETEG